MPLTLMSALGGKRTLGCVAATALESPRSGPIAEGVRSKACPLPACLTASRFKEKFTKAPGSGGASRGQWRESMLAAGESLTTATIYFSNARAGIGRIPQQLCAGLP